MGIFDSIKEKADTLDKTYNPMRKAADALNGAADPAASVSSPSDTTPQQKAYEAKQDQMNKSNPYYTPPGRAKGGPVKAGKKYTVGEKGPETFVPKQSGQIIPNQGMRTKKTPTGKIMKKNFE